LDIGSSSATQYQEFGTKAGARHRRLRWARLKIQPEIRSECARTFHREIFPLRRKPAATQGERSRAWCAASISRKGTIMTTKPSLIAYAVKNRGKGQKAI
jgi:hypothetical protein